MWLINIIRNQMSQVTVVIVIAQDMLVVARQCNATSQLSPMTLSQNVDEMDIMCTEEFPEEVGASFDHGVYENSCWYTRTLSDHGCALSDLFN